MSYARGTFAALVDAIVPETPKADDPDDVPGGLAVDLQDAVVDRVNDLQEVEEGSLLAFLGYDRAPLAPAVAAMFDFAALELVVRRRAEDGLRDPDEAFAGGPFSRLSRRDRLRAIRMLETEGVLPALADRYGEEAPGPGVVQYLTGAAVTLTEFLYYTEVTGDGETSQGWEQVGYPGPSDGYRVLLGYEVEEFEENDY